MRPLSHPLDYPGPGLDSRLGRQSESQSRTDEKAEEETKEEPHGHHPLELLPTSRLTTNGNRHPALSPARAISGLPIAIGG